jgi:hypothetical protein
MTVKHHLAASIVVAASLLAGLPGLAAAEDLQEVSRYTLTEAGLAKYAKATRNLAAIPGACEADEDDDDDSNSQSIDDMVAKLDATPGAKAAIESAGLTPREYVVFTFSMMQSGMAAWAQSQPNAKLPPGISQANIDFYRKHEAALAALGENDPCAGDAGDEEPAE